MAEKDTVRDCIIEAAKKRFSHFGYAKTTMAEVAGDCEMSPGNLYRFFPGKLDIAEAIATEDYTKQYCCIWPSSPSSRARTRASGCTIFCSRNCAALITSWRRTRARSRWRASSARSGPTFANWMLENERKILIALLDEAERRGEFSVADKQFTAEMVPGRDDEVPLSAIVVEADAAQARTRA